MRIARWLDTFTVLVVSAALASAAVVAWPVVTGSDAPAQAKAPDRNVRVMTFNIHHGAGADGVVDLARVARVIREGDPDVVGLQEVDRHFDQRSDFVDQATWLARTLRMRVIFGANLDLDPLAPGQPRRQYGTAILSNRPILEWDNTYLPRFPDHEQRGLLRARISVRGVPVQVYNTHLQHDNAAERLAQAEAIQQLIGAPRDPVVLLGDLNATPAAPEIRTLVEDLVDAWEAAGVGDGATFPSEDPQSRIDYIMHSDDVVARAIAVVATPLAASASDHLPVMADVALPGQKVRIRH